MNSNQTLHLTIKEPPNPNPIRTLGIFELPIKTDILEAFLSGVPNPVRSKEFIDNVKDEVIKALESGKVTSAYRSGNELRISILTVPK